MDDGRLMAAKKPAKRQIDYKRVAKIYETALESIADSTLDHDARAMAEEALITAKENI